MGSSSPLWDVLSWVGVPVSLFLISTGLGLLTERVARVSLPPGLVAPLGFCVSIVLMMPVYRLGAPAPFAVAVVCAAAIVGFALARRELRSRLSSGSAGVAGIATYALFIAPTALSGGWTWSGYNLANDTAVHLLLAEYIKTTGAVLHLRPASTQNEFLKAYFLTRYPLGTHAQLATLSELLGASPAALYQSYISAMAGFAGMALATLARRTGFSALAACAVAVTAAGASLLYSYALQGSVKELAMFTTLAIAAALGRELLIALRPFGLAVAVALCGAASLIVYSAGALPYVGSLAAALVVGSFVVRDSALRRRLLPTSALAAGTFAVAAIPALIGLATFSRVATGQFAGAAPDLGQLARPLPLSEAAGVWLAGDYRLPISSHRLELATQVMIIAIVALVVIGALLLVRIREPGPLLFLVPAAVTLAVVAPRVSPYADAKLLAILSPAVVFTSAYGLLALRRYALPLSVGIGVVLAFGVLGSDAYGYHDTKLAAVDRLRALQDAGRRLDNRGMVLVNEFEEFAKYAAYSTQLNTAFEALTPFQVRLRTPTSFYGHYFDLDAEQLDYVEQFPFIIKRRSPDASRPPANFRLIYVNRYYEAWQRLPRPRVMVHVPLQQTFVPTLVPRCADVLRLGRFAGAVPGRQLIAAVRPELSEFDPNKTAHTRGWLPDPLVPGDLRLNVPGQAHGTVHVRGGRYALWVQGSFGRPLHVLVNGRQVGSVNGINTPGQWFQAATLRLPAGTYELEVRRGGKSLRPGDGAVSDLGPVALAAVGPTRLRWVAPRHASELCGQRYDWLEVVQR